MTVPFPVPLFPDVIVIHGSLLVAVHVQVLADEVTVTLPEPPVESNDWLVGEMAKVQPSAAKTVFVETARDKMKMRTLAVVMAFFILLISLLWIHIKHDSLQCELRIVLKYICLFVL